MDHLVLFSPWSAASRTRGSPSPSSRPTWPGTRSDAGSTPSSSRSRSRKGSRSATGRLGVPATREALLDILGLRGAWPPSWPLRVQVKETLRRDGYAIEKLTYESWPGMAVPALLYVPERVPPGKAPGVVSISGHHYRARCQRLSSR